VQQELAKTENAAAADWGQLAETTILPAGVNNLADQWRIQWSSLDRVSPRAEVLR
jgi:hypothetical protein